MGWGLPLFQCRICKDPASSCRQVPSAVGVEYSFVLYEQSASVGRGAGSAWGAVRRWITPSMWRQLQPCLLAHRNQYDFMCE